MHQLAAKEIVFISRAHDKTKHVKENKYGANSEE